MLSLRKCRKAATKAIPIMARTLRTSALPPGTASGASVALSQRQQIGRDSLQPLTAPWEPEDCHNNGIRCSKNGLKQTVTQVIVIPGDFLYTY